MPLGEAEVKAGELKLALQLVDQTSAKKFKPEAYKDHVAERVHELIERKVQGEDIVAAPEEAPKAQIIDLMEALKASLGEGGGAGRKPAKRAPAKPAAEKKAAPAKKVRARAR